jgi:predicted site-specific integrase-resolvase|tara:strand:- start:242 stop:490 length:249 start_codon:yes stop_codon:yes gene_type:complete
MMSEYVTINAVAKKFDVSISTVRVWLRKNYIPRNTYIKVGNTYRFKLDEIEHHFKGNSEPEISDPIPLIEEGMPELNLDEDV